MLGDQMNCRRVIVTGGAGFIGARVCRILQARGIRVGAIDNMLVHRPLLSRSETYDPFECDIRDVSRIEYAFRSFEPDAVVHLAAIHHIPTCENDPREAMDVNVTGTQTILDAARRFGVRKLVIASSAAVYDWSDGPLVEYETPTKPTDVYSVGKITNENQAVIWAEKTAGTCAIARIFNVIGHDDPNGHLIPDILAQLGIQDGKITRAEIFLGNLEPKRDYTHAEDTARGVVALLDHTSRFSGIEIFNVSYGAEFSVVELVGIMSDYFGKTIKISSDPARKRQIDRLHLLGDTTRARSLLGWQAKIELPKAINDILSKLVQENRANSRFVLNTDETA